MKMTARLLGTLFATSLLGTLLLLATPQASAEPLPTLYDYEVVESLPHDENAFTQGIVYDSGKFYESLGLYGESEVRVIDLKTGKATKHHGNERHIFGEGLTLWENTLVQIAWKTNEGFTYDKDTLEPKEGMKTGMANDGWGLTHNATHLIGTDSSTWLYVLDPKDYSRKQKLLVHDGEKKVKWLNEIQFIGESSAEALGTKVTGKGEVWGMIWQTECVARVDPTTGSVLGWVLMKGLRQRAIREGGNRRSGHTDVLNGIAWDAEGGRLWMTGKKWARLFQVKIKKLPEAKQTAEEVARARARCIRPM